MATLASKQRRAARHADEKAGRAANRIIAATAEDIDVPTVPRSIPALTWLNGRQYKNQAGGRKNRPGNHTLHAQAEQENHDRSVAQKMTVEYHTTDPNEVLPPHVGETKVVVQPPYEDENGKTWLYNPDTKEWDIPA